MAFSPENLLGTPSGYATPDQLASVQQYAQLLMKGGQRDKEITSPWQGVRMMADTLAGGHLRNQAAQQQMGNLGLDADTRGMQSPPGGAMGAAPESAQSAPQAPAGGGVASVRNNNPGAQWPGPIASQFGATGSQTIGGGNKIAQFPDPIHGAAAEFALLDKSYSGMPLGAAIGKWSGGNSAGAYAQHIAQRTGLSPSTVITPQLLRSPQGVALGKAMADWEAGGKSPLTDQQWEQAHQMAFAGPTGLQTAGLPSAITQGGSPPAGSPQAMSGALAANGAHPAGGPGSPPAASHGDPTFGAQYAPSRPQVSPEMMQRIWRSPSMAPEEKQMYYQQYMQQNQPVEAAGPAGRWVIPSGGGKPLWIPELQKGELDAGGVKAPYMGTINPGPNGPQFQGVQGVPGIGGTPSKPPSDLNGLPDMHPQPAGKPPSPQGSLAPPPGPAMAANAPPPGGAATAAQGASPMGAMAAAGAAPPQGAPAGAQTALATPGNVGSDAPPIGGMLGTPPPQMGQGAPQGKPPAGPQVAQNAGGLPSLSELRDFKLNMDQRGELNKEDVKKYTENSNAVMQAGTQAQQGLPMLKMAKEAVQDPKYYSGIGVDVVMDLKRLKASIGEDPKAAAANEIFEKGMAGDVLSQLRAKLQGLGQVRLAEIDLLSRATANKYNTPAANLAVLNIIERGYNQMNEMSQVANAYAGGARLDAKGNWTHGDDPPTNAGLNELMRTYLTNHQLFSKDEIANFNKTFDLDAKAPTGSSTEDKLGKFYSNRPPAGGAAAPSVDDKINAAQKRLQQLQGK